MDARRTSFSLVKWNDRFLGALFLKKYTGDYLVLALVSGSIIILDQLTKFLVRQNLAMGEMWTPWDWLAPYARIINWHNTGAAFGMFQGMSDVFKVLAILVAIAIVFYYPRVPRSDWTLRLAMCMQLGGAVGNLIDRFAQGYVTDFVSVGTFPVWNIADASITIGVVVLLLGVYLQERKQKKQALDNEANPATGDQRSV